MEIYAAKFDFCQDCESSLSFKRGDKFFITDKMDGGWWAARSLSSNEVGYIPSSYIECIAILDPLTLKYLDMPPKPDRMKMDALCELTAKIQQSSSPGRNHPRYHTENYFGDEKEAPPTPPELKRTTTPLSLSKEQNELQKDLKLSQQRGMQLGRPELVKQWEKFELKKTVKAEKGKTTENELETKLRNISQKLEDHEKQQEVEAKKPEFMRVNLKKASKEVEAS